VIIIIIFLIMFLLASISLVLIIISTNKREGRWGINTSTVVCPKCGTTFPKVRKPANLRQALWGGGTCKNCSCEVDKWGKEINKT
jgi:hypothetical protein